MTTVRASAPAAVVSARAVAGTAPRRRAGGVQGHGTRGAAPVRTGHDFAGVPIHHGDAAVRGGSPVLQRQPRTARRKDPVADAQQAAFYRTFLAHQRVAGIGPSPPPGRMGETRLEQQRARRLAQRMFEWANPNMEQIAGILGDMRGRLAGHGIPTVRAPASDPECGGRKAYVVGFRPPIHLCPAFFRTTDEQRTRTMIHEAAHLSRIGKATVGESYCIEFDCDTSCGGFESADSWAHYVHCLSDQPPDKPLGSGTP